MAHSEPCRAPLNAPSRRITPQVMASVVRRCRDADSAVREAAADAAGALTAMAVAVAREAGPASVGHVVLRAPLDALGENSQFGQLAACLSLAKILPALGAAGVDGGPAKLALRLLKAVESDSFSARPAALAALAALLEARRPLAAARAPRDDVRALVSSSLPLRVTLRLRLR